MKNIIVHIDDIWSTLNSNKAAFDLLENWLASSWSLMVPCVWFNDAIKKYNSCKNIDLWLHLTLTSERDKWYVKWKPTLPTWEVKSLTDKDGYFHKTIDEVFLHANEEEIKNELLNQIKIAQISGVQLSHIDSHMWLLLHSKFFELYKHIAEKTWIQPFICKPSNNSKLGHRFHNCHKFIDDLQINWFKVFDNFDAYSLYDWNDFNDFELGRLENIKDWTTYFLIHVSYNHHNDYLTTPDFLLRQKEYIFFKKKFAQSYFNKNWISLISVKQFISS